MNWRKWCDEFVLAAKGVLLASKEKRFWYGFVPAFLFFGWLMNMLSGGFANFELMGAVGFPNSLKIVGDNFIGIFGINRLLLDWLPIFCLSILQGALIGIIVLLWNKKRLNSTDSNNSENVQKAGIITGLIALGAGCPTCGTTLLTPLIGTLFSSSSLAITGAVSVAVTIMAISIAILSLKRLGLETYAIIINEKFLKKRRAKEKSEKIS